MAEKEYFRMESLTQRVCAVVAVCLCWGILALILVGDILRDRH